MNQEITKYLNGAKPDFSTGFALFCKYSRNECLMSWISRKQDMPKLLYELKKLADLDVVKINPLQEANMARYGQNLEAQKPSAPKAATETQRFKTYDERKTRRADLPEDLQKVYDTISEDYKLRRGLHEKMKMATTNDDRAGFRARILETDGRIRKGWAKIDAYLSKQAAEKEKAKAADDFKESTARSYISKALKKDEISDAQKATIKARYDALIAHGCTVTDELKKQLQDRKLI